MMARLISLARDARGAVTIELAILAPILAAMLIGLVGLSDAFSNKLRLEQIAQRVIEKVQQDGFDTTMETALETEAKGAAGTGSIADLTFWLECAGTKVASYTGGCTPGQSVARYVQLKIKKNYAPPIAARFGSASNADGTITVNGIAGLRIQ